MLEHWKQPSPSSVDGLVIRLSRFLMDMVPRPCPTSKDEVPNCRGAGYGFTSYVCLSVFMQDVSKTDAARIAKLDIQTFHDET